MEKIALTNRAGKFAIVDDRVLEAMKADPHLKAIRFLENLRAHSNGYAFFQRFLGGKDRKKYETIYLHKYVAEHFIEKPVSDQKLFVRFVDGNVLNAQISNLEWATMSKMRRLMKGGRSVTGYRGVTYDRKKYRAIIYYHGKAYDLGFHDTPEEAALAYNKKSRELFGETPSLNTIEPTGKDQ